MLKITKKLLLFLIAVMAMSNVSFANEYVVPAELSSYGEGIYKSARSYFGRSFDGYCGTYVRCQLRAMGIFDGKFDFRGNGNQWYRNFENVQKTSGGYYVYRESGSDCIDKLTQKYGESLSNIVVSFPIQAGYSSRYPGAGHAFIIYRLQDGIAYYSESFSYGENREGEVIAENIDDLIVRYSKRHGAPTGCVLLSKDILSDEIALLGSEEMMQNLMESIEGLSDIEFVASRFADISPIDYSVI